MPNAVTLEATSRIIAYPAMTAVVAGEGAIDATVSATGNSIGFNSATLTGISHLLAYPTLTAVIGGEGSIDASIDGKTVKVSLGASYLQGISTLESKGHSRVSSGSSLVAIANLLAAGGKSFENSLILQGTSSVLAYPTMTAVIGGEGSIDASIDGKTVKVSLGASYLQGVASFTSKGRVKVASGASLEATATLSASGGKSSENSATLEATATLSVSGGKVSGSVASLQATATLSVSGGKVSGSVASLQATAALSASGGKVSRSVASLEATATLSVSGGKVSRSVASLEGVATLSASGGKSSENSVILQGTSRVLAYPTMIAVIGGEGSIDASIDGKTTKVAIGASYLQGIANVASKGRIEATPIVSLEATATLSALGGKVSGSVASLQATATLSALGGKVSGSVASLQATATLSALGGKSSENSVILQGTSRILAYPTMIAVIGGEGSIDASIDGKTTKVAIGASYLQGVASFTSKGRVKVASGASLEATATLSVSGGKVSRSVASLEATATLSASGGKSSENTATLEGVATLSVSGGKVSGSVASLQATAALSASGGKSSENSVTLQGISHILAYPTMIAVIGGEGSIDASIDGKTTKVAVGASYLQGIANVAANGRTKSTSGVSLEGIATLSAPGGKISRTGSSLEGRATLFASGSQASENSVTLQGISRVLAYPTMIAVIGGEGSIDASIDGKTTKVAIGASYLQGIANLDSTASAILRSNSELVGRATLTTKLGSVWGSSATLLGTATLSGRSWLSGQSSLECFASITASGVIIARPGVSTTSNAAIDATPNAAMHSKASLQAVATFHPGAGLRHQGSADLVGVADLEVTSSMSANGLAILFATASIDADGTTTIGASPTTLTAKAFIAGNSSALSRSSAGLLGTAEIVAGRIMLLGGEIVFEGTTSGVLHNYADLTTSFDVLETEVVGFDSEFDVGKSVLRWYQVETECRTLSCQTGVSPADDCFSTGVAGGHRVIAILAARGLMDLCTRLQAPQFNPALNLPIRSITRSSRSVYSTISEPGDEDGDVGSYIRTCQNVVVTGFARGTVYSDNISIPNPSSVVGHLLVAILASDGVADFAPAPGWTPMFLTDTVNGLSIRAFTKIRGASEPFYHEFPHTLSSSETVAGIVVSWSGADQFNPIFNYGINTSESPAVSAVPVNSSSESSVDVVAVMVEPSNLLSDLSNGISLGQSVSQGLSIRAAMDTVHSNVSAWGPTWTGRAAPAWVLTISPNPSCEESLVSPATFTNDPATPKDCQSWEFVDFCHIAECVGFCVDSQPTAKAKGYGRVVTLYDSTIGGNIVFTGESSASAPPPPPQTGLQFFGESIAIVRTALATPTVGGTISFHGGATTSTSQLSAYAKGIVSARFLSVQYSNISEITYAPPLLSHETVCGCTLPGNLYITHNLIRASRLTSFLSRIGGDIPREIVLHRTSDGKWRKNFNFNSSENESWRIVFEYYCHDPVGFANPADLVWRFGIFAKNQKEDADLESRLLIEFSAETCPEPGSIELEADTESGIAMANGVDASFVLSDDCGMFASRVWTDDPVFAATIGESTAVFTGRREITNL